MTDEAKLALSRAANAALHAPSVFNTQPWRWVVRGDTLELFADDRRRLPLHDPDGHLLLLSCGAALHHARVALTAEAWTHEVEHSRPERYDPANSEPLARVRLTGRSAVDPAAMRHFQATLVRHTDRRVLADEPVDPAAVEAVRTAVRAEGAQLHIAHPDEVLQIATAVEQAAKAEQHDERQADELAAWLDGGRAAGTGVPDAAIPSSPTRTTVPSRDFGRSGELAAGSGHDRTAVFVVLYGDGDDPGDWLRGGEALSAGWLAATEQGLTLLPYSAPIEILPAREALRRMLSGLGYPYLAARLGATDPDHAGPAHTPRLDADAVIEVVD